MFDADEDFEFDILPLPINFSSEELTKVNNDLELCKEAPLLIQKTCSKISNQPSQQYLTTDNNFVELVYSKSNQRNETTSRFNIISITDKERTPSPLKYIPIVR